MQGTIVKFVAEQLGKQTLKQIDFKNQYLNDTADSILGNGKAIKEIQRSITHIDNNVNFIKERIEQAELKEQANKYFDECRKIFTSLESFLQSLNNDRPIDELENNAKSIVTEGSQASGGQSYKTLAENILYLFCGDDKILIKGLEPLKNKPLITLYSNYMLQKNYSLIEYIKQMTLLADHYLKYLAIIQVYFDTAYKFLHGIKIKPGKRVNLIENYQERVIEYIYKENITAYELFNKIYFPHKNDFYILKKEDARALDCSIGRTDAKGKTFEVHGKKTQCPVYIDYKKLINNNQRWNIAPFSPISTSKLEDIKLLQEKECLVAINSLLESQNYYLGVYEYSIRFSVDTGSRVFSKYINHEIIGVEKNDIRKNEFFESEDRIKWQILLTPEKEYIMLQNMCNKNVLDGNTKYASRDLGISEGSGNLFNQQLYCSFKPSTNFHQLWKLEEII